VPANWLIGEIFCYAERLAFSFVFFANNFFFKAASFNLKKHKGGAALYF